MAMRNCYRAELNAMPATDEEMVEKVMKKRHLSLLEFVDVSVNITCDRGVTHELVRHRPVFICSGEHEILQLLRREVWAGTDICQAELGCRT